MVSSSSDCHGSQQARALFPQFSFAGLDITADAKPAPSTAAATGSRLFMVRGMLWSVFPKLANMVRNVRSLLSVVKNFPPLEKNFVGKDVIPDHVAPIRHFSTEFVPVRHLWYQDTLKTANDNWFIGLFSPR